MVPHLRQPAPHPSASFSAWARPNFLHRPTASGATLRQPLLAAQGEGPNSKSPFAGSSPWKFDVASFTQKARKTPSRPPTPMNDDIITVYNVDRMFDECRQASIPRSYEFLFVTFAQLKKGSCYPEGFTEPVSMETANFFFGDVKIRLYKRTPVPQRVAAFRRQQGPKTETPADPFIGSQLVGQTSSDVLSIPALVMIGLVAGSGISFTLLGFRRATSTQCKEALLA